MGRKKKVSRGQLRAAKSKWKAKKWYQVFSPQLFGKAEIGMCLSRDPEQLIGRNIEPALNELTGDFSKSHIIPKFKISSISGEEAHTTFLGHRLTSDYTRRLTYRKCSKIDVITNTKTKDGATVRVKMVGITRKRIQTSQKKEIRAIAERVLLEEATKNTNSEFIKDMLGGDLAKKVFYATKILYPLKKIEFRRSEILKEPLFSEDEGIEEEQEESEETPETDNEEGPVEELLEQA